jgi:predicted ATPase
LEDVHWADELSLSLVAYLAKSLVDASLLLMLVHRSMPLTEMELLADTKNLPYAHTIDLEPLSPAESLELIKMMLGEKRLSPDTEKILLDRGQGNPFFLQEITGAILDVAESQTDQHQHLSTPIYRTRFKM